jgi:hypothetical protein
VNQSDHPLLTEEAWVDVWLRTRSGPTPKGSAVSVSVWHRVRDLAGWAGRARTVCGYGPRNGFTWPNGGSRWEVARPQTYGTLPGVVCPRCLALPATTEPDIEQEQVLLDELDLDDVAARVAERLRALATPTAEDEG